MQGIFYGLRRHLRIETGKLRAAPRRHVSLTGAIERGVRQGKKSIEARERARDGQWKYGDTSHESERSDRLQWRLDDASHSKSEGASHVDGPTHSSAAPKSTPYTTASSEFIYGTFGVRAALKAQRRKLHKLYISTGGSETPGMVDRSLARRAEEQGVEVLHVNGQAWKQMMLRMSNDRPHNGHVLEASRLPLLPGRRLEACQNLNDSKLKVKLQPQDTTSAEGPSAFEVEGSLASIPCKSRRRFPLLLFLDRIGDTGNIGAIIRSAYYFGAEAIVMLEHGTAPLNSVAVKASAGAAEYLPIIQVRDERKFIKESQVLGWHFVAAVAPESLGRYQQPSKNNDSTQAIPASHNLVAAPTVLMLGNEGTGLRPQLERMADSRVSIEDAVGKHDGLDSLNVSVAAALLMRDLLCSSLVDTTAQVDN